ncbi:MAG TPA: carboxypeptidase-like regulatory domain-containing protein, partial [Chitinophagaceae bacterium]|nr:carboxypeptidase-like regulatory domain-containing protein [Chitinophagaceae bacterium]
MKRFAHAGFISGLLLGLLSASIRLSAQGNNIIVISGTVIDQTNKQPLEGVNVLVKGTVSGTSTDKQGGFNLRTKAKFPFMLVISSIGFQSQEFEVKGTDSRLNIALVTQTQLGSEVVV